MTAPSDLPGYGPNRCRACQKEIRGPQPTDDCGDHGPFDMNCICCDGEMEMGPWDGDEETCPDCGRVWIYSVDEDSAHLIAKDEDEPCKCDES